MTTETQAKTAVGRFLYAVTMVPFREFNQTQFVVEVWADDPEQARICAEKDYPAEASYIEVIDQSDEEDEHKRSLVFGALNNAVKNGYSISESDVEAEELIRQESELEMYEPDDLIPYVEEWKQNHTRHAEVASLLLSIKHAIGLLEAGKIQDAKEYLEGIQLCTA